MIRILAGATLATVVFTTHIVHAQSMGEFPPGSFGELKELPVGRFHDELKQLPPQAQQRAQAWLRDMHFTSQDLHSMHTDANGGICFACDFQLPPAGEIEGDASVEESENPGPALAAVPISPFPNSLKFSSRPGATNVIYINFSGQVIEGTEWNTVVGRTSIPTLPFSTDSDFTTFSDAEQVAIKRIWMRMAEDYAPFDVNVTTAPPATITNRTAVVLITRSTDANGAANPYSSAGGVAYVNVFGRTDFISRYSPAFVYHNNLSSNESFIAEAASHEIGHNLGLGHDGLTTGADYYGGHGSGDISWATIMGTGYNRNVSQWSKGEYFNANNTQDDLAVIAGKLNYRTDDHGNTPGTATALVITNSNQIASTNFGNDPANTNPANKGVIERNTDVDVFSFVTGDGPVTLTANPWVMPAGTRGGNLDILLELRDESGVIIATSNPADKTGATISTMLSQGQYFLHVRNTGTGGPLSSPPSGYTAYGSIGTYYLSGSITDGSGFNPAPLAQLQVGDITAVGTSSHTLTVTYSDNFAINVATLGTGDIRVTGPNGYNQLAIFVSVDTNTNGTPRVATYSLPPPSGTTWVAAQNGAYQVSMEPDQVADTQGAFVAAGLLGEFQVTLPVPIYSANMDSNPGWTLDAGTQNNPGWQYGAPNYGGNTSAPSAGFSGTNIIAYNLSGHYTKNLTIKYATTPNINASSASNLTLQFRRWLRVTNQGTAAVQVSKDGTNWTTLWSGSRVTDASWQLVQYALPSSMAGSSTLRLRWSLASSPGGQTDIGWNIDDVVLLGDGVIDTDPPVPLLNVSNLTAIGSPSHTCGVNYTDASGVRLASLDAGDLVVTGPNGYTTLLINGDIQTSILEFLGADRVGDGSPINASYGIPAPNGNQWQAADNGTYTVTLRAGSVEDTLNNAVLQTVLGTFEVAIVQAAPGELVVTPEAGLASSGEAGGGFSPTSITFTLSNTGGITLDWTASKTAAWIDLSADGGTILPGATAEVSATLNAQATALAAGEYGDIISFVNTSSGIGNTGRNVALSVSPADEIIRFTSFGRDEQGTFKMLVVGNPGDPVTVQWSDDMATWNTLAATVIGPEGTLAVEDPASVDEPKRFYRLGTP